MIEKGTRVFIPIHGFHYDPKIYNLPMTFNPERFNEDNVKKRHPFSYLPYGVGADCCYAKHMGHLLIKVGLLSFLIKYQIKSCASNEKFHSGRKSSYLNHDNPINLQIENYS